MASDPNLVVALRKAFAEGNTLKGNGNSPLEKVVSTYLSAKRTDSYDQNDIKPWGLMLRAQKTLNEEKFDIVADSLQEVFAGEAKVEITARSPGKKEGDGVAFRISGLPESKLSGPFVSLSA